VEGVVGLTWTDRSVLVTGAGGFIGSWLTRRLVEAGADVVALAPDLDPRSELVRSGTAGCVTIAPGVLEDPDAVARVVVGREVDTVFHLGAQTIVGAAHRDPVTTFEANVRGTYLLLDACRQARGAVERIVVASSDKAYGTVGDLPYTERTPLDGRGPYDVSKTATDLLAQSYAATYDLPVAIARCGNVYGGGDLNWSRIVPGTIRAIVRGEQPVLRSDGTFVRDYLHVDDVVEAYLALAGWLDTTHSAGEHSHASDGIAFNFSAEAPLTVMEIYAAVCEACGGSVEPRVLGEAAGEIHDQFLDSSRAQAELAWKAAVALGDGLTRTVEWYRALLVAS
jgi:CDP-glucose 4,6-dehydratase